MGPWKWPKSLQANQRNEYQPSNVVRRRGFGRHVSFHILMAQIIVVRNECGILFCPSAKQYTDVEWTPGKIVHFFSDCVYFQFLNIFGVFWKTLCLLLTCIYSMLRMLILLHILPLRTSLIASGSFLLLAVCLLLFSCCKLTDRCSDRGFFVFSGCIPTDRSGDAMKDIYQKSNCLPYRKQRGDVELSTAYQRWNSLDALGWGTSGRFFWSSFLTFRDQIIPRFSPLRT